MNESMSKKNQLINQQVKWINYRSKIQFRTEPESETLHYKEAAPYPT